MNKVGVVWVVRWNGVFNTSDNCGGLDLIHCLHTAYPARSPLQNEVVGKGALITEDPTGKIQKQNSLS